MVLAISAASSQYFSFFSFFFSLRCQTHSIYQWCLAVHFLHPSCYLRGRFAPYYYYYFLKFWEDAKCQYYL